MTRRLRVRRGCGEAGITLVELMVSMFILTFVTGIFTVSFTSLQTGLRKQNGDIDAQAASLKAFTVLDRQVRYANALNDPAVANGSQYVEWQSGDIGANQTCTQWREVLATGTLQWRQWTLTVASPTTPVPAAPVWYTVLTGLDVSAGNAFSTQTSDPGVFASLGESPTLAAPIERQLGVTLNVTSGSPAGRATASSIFSAQNTVVATTPTTPVCQQLGRP